jgi:lipopolysaccharide biosynthesis protein
MRLTDEEIAFAQEAPRLCLFAHYDEHGVVGDHVIHYLAALKKAGFAVLVASSAALNEAEAAKLRLHCDGLELRSNVGLDFGSWKDLIARIALTRTELLMLCNDSVYGPLVDLTSYLEVLTQQEADFYGACGSIEYAFHLQSWFLLFRPSAFASPAFAAFFEDRSVPATKRDIVVENEVRLTKVLIAAGLRYACAYNPMTDGLISRYVPFNATHLLWRQLLATGKVPFIKIDLMRDNPLAIGDVANRRPVVAQTSASLELAIEHDLQRRPARAQPSKSSWLGRFGTLDPVFRPDLRQFLIRDFEAAQRGRSAVLLVNCAIFMGIRIVYLAFGRLARIARQWYPSRVVSRLKRS